MLSHLDHNIIKVKSDSLIVGFEVTVLDKNITYYKFKWTVEKHTSEGPLKCFWLTKVVSATIFLGSSI